jgi:hypothetical protein
MLSVPCEGLLDKYSRQVYVDLPTNGFYGRKGFISSGLNIDFLEEDSQAQANNFKSSNTPQGVANRKTPVITKQLYKEVIDPVRDELEAGEKGVIASVCKPEVFNEDTPVYVKDKDGNFVEVKEKLHAEFKVNPVIRVNSLEKLEKEADNYKLPYED